MCLALWLILSPPRRLYGGSRRYQGCYRQRLGRTCPPTAQDGGHRRMCSSFAASFLLSHSPCPNLNAFSLPLGIMAHKSLASPPTMVDVDTSPQPVFRSILLCLGSHVNMAARFRTMRCLGQHDGSVRGITLLTFLQCSRLFFNALLQMFKLHWPANGH
jgi:hypothetical protein